ncbi:hypothetical protein RP20_CCG024440 [Aedes albopictus]|nr:hypothetical protein RP20_CCG024440 [Aedes albopictus]
MQRITIISPLLVRREGMGIDMNMKIWLKLFSRARCKAETEASKRVAWCQTASRPEVLLGTCSDRPRPVSQRRQICPTILSTLDDYDNDDDNVLPFAFRVLVVQSVPKLCRGFVFPPLCMRTVIKIKDVLSDGLCSTTLLYSTDSRVDWTDLNYC